jgi:hypothetical protein
VGNYHSFGRREAESYARALRKQRERAAKESEEKRIWGELAEEQIKADRIRAALKPPPAAKVPKAKKSDEELAVEAVREAVAAYERHADGIIAALQRGDPPSYWRRRPADVRTNRGRQLAYVRHCGARVSDRRGNHLMRLHCSLLRRSARLSGSDLCLSKDEDAALLKRMKDADIRVRSAARDVLRWAGLEARSEILDVFRQMREERREKRREGAVT